MKYDIFANGRHHSEHPGWVAACAVARAAAHNQPGTTFEVERNGEKVARYRLAGTGGKLEVWMR